MAVLSVSPPDPAAPLVVVLDLSDVATSAPVGVTYRQQAPLPATDYPVDPADVAVGVYATTVELVGEVGQVFRLAPLIFDGTGLAESAPFVAYTPVAPPAPTGWPADSDLADRLGLTGGDDAGRVGAANAAAQADAVAVCGLDPDQGAEDAGQWEGVLLLGQWWYESRNRPEGLDSLNPQASPYYRRTALGIIQRGAMPIA